ncbi:MAG: glutamate racemase [Clostridia bacterium]|nr:glutamate racemase [Clostridia bacterium]
MNRTAGYQPDSTCPIGVFDSGVGGISVLAALRRELPCEDFLYFGDTAHAPYGTKNPEEVLQFSREIMDRLMQKRIKCLVIACNTASAVAAKELREETDLPIIAMEPALKPASLLRHGGKVLVLATPMTLRLPKFQRLYALYGEGAVPVPCPGLMEKVETADDDGARAYLEKILTAHRMDQVDAIVLGCTHYSFLRPLIRKMLPENVPVLDGNAGTARQTGHVLSERSLLRDEAREGTIEFLTSGNPETVLPQMHMLWERAQHLV